MITSITIKEYEVGKMSNTCAANIRKLSLSINILVKCFSDTLSCKIRTFACGLCQICFFFLSFRAMLKEKKKKEKLEQRKAEKLAAEKAKALEKEKEKQREKQEREKEKEKLRARQEREREKARERAERDKQREEERKERERRKCEL